MSRILRKIGKFYSGIFMGNIGLFIFVGLLSVLFQEQGWFPNEKLYEISQIVYAVVLPTCIGYIGGEKIAGRNGGVLAVLMLAGVLTSDSQVGILAGMIAGPAGGILWKYAGKRIKEYADFSLQMLTGNLLVGILGGVLAVFGYYVLAPALVRAAMGISGCLEVLLVHRLLGLANVVVEPLKVLFLNNILNHGILVPLGINQVQETGKSVLFLLEANPGPGLGMLAALCLTCREKREEYGIAVFAQSIGGIHEVYFPYVLAKPWLLLPLIAGGVTGTLCFEILDVGTAAPVSPGSAVTVLLMAGKENLIGAAAGMGISAAAAFLGTVLAVRLRAKRNGQSSQKELPEPAEEPMENEKKQETVVEKEEERKMPLRRIGFVCDAGVGSSAMGAALFRRKLVQNGIQGVEVQAYASDQIPDDLDLIVCQKDFLRLLPDSTEKREVLAVDSLMGGENFEELIKSIKERNR